MHYMTAGTSRRAQGPNTQQVGNPSQQGNTFWELVGLHTYYTYMVAHAYAQLRTRTLTPIHLCTIWLGRFGMSSSVYFGVIMKYSVLKDKYDEDHPSCSCQTSEQLRKVCPILSVNLQALTDQQAQQKVLNTPIDSLITAVSTVHCTW